MEIGFEFYIWAGPLDSITREYPCRHWVWHWFKASELTTLRAIRNSLWNCRHSIIPIDEEDKKNYKRGNIKIANKVLK
jgi:hypothetical protein